MQWSGRGLADGKRLIDCGRRVVVAVPRLRCMYGHAARTCDDAPVFPEIVAGPEAMVSLTGRPELAVALTVKSASPKALFASSVKADRLVSFFVYGQRPVPLAAAKPLSPAARADTGRAVPKFIPDRVALGDVEVHCYSLTALPTDSH